MASKEKPLFPILFYNARGLGEAIKKVRRLRGVTQQELSQWSKTSVKFISNVENGKETAEIGKILTLLRVLDVGMNLTNLRLED
ncbi:MAG: helix-turn-helix domain-containing protein [Desulfovibrionaceae bacterium]|nr:helix-turn-helix domain-containing protein [Desulfovibrionaceae bacterium]